MKEQLRKTLKGICSIIPWVFASSFAMKWLRHMTNGTISYSSESGGAVLQFLCAMAFVGLALTTVLAVLSFKWKVNTKWQAILFIAGLLSFWSIVGD
jgi:hypothetical protein